MPLRAFRLFSVALCSECGHPVSDQVSDCYDRKGDQGVFGDYLQGGFSLGLRH